MFRYFKIIYELQCRSSCVNTGTEKDFLTTREHRTVSRQLTVERQCNTCYSTQFMESSGRQNAPWRSVFPLQLSLPPSLRHMYTVTYYNLQWTLKGSDDGVTFRIIGFLGFVPRPIF
jgi:hypothetical protein